MSGRERITTKDWPKWAKTTRSPELHKANNRLDLLKQRRRKILSKLLTEPNNINLLGKLDKLNVEIKTIKDKRNYELVKHWKSRAIPFP